jgi:TonB family protein
MIAGLLFATLWQGALILGITAIVVRCVPRRNAATHYAVWCLALLAIAAVPIATAFSHAGADLLHRFRPHAAAQAQFSLLLTPLEAAQTRPASANDWILALWVVGASVSFARLIVSFARIARITRNTRAWRDTYPDVRLSDDVAVPIAAGALNPSVILPAGLAETLSAADLNRIIEHERAHIRRGDVLANALQRCIEAALYFNPCVWIVGRQVSLAREAACDDVAVQATGEQQTYALCLARLVGIAQQRTPLATPSALGSRHALVNRIERLMSIGSTAQITPNYYTIGATVILFAAMTLALQAFSPAAITLPTQTLSMHAARAVIAANTSCNAPAMVTAPVPPRPPAGTKSGWADIKVTVSPNGSVTKAVVAHSSGDPAINKAAIDAATASTFSPKMVNCKPVAGTYLFRVTVHAP